MLIIILSHGKLWITYGSTKRRFNDLVRDMHELYKTPRKW